MTLTTSIRNKRICTSDIADNNGDQSNLIAGIAFMDAPTKRGVLCCRVYHKEHSKCRILGQLPWKADVNRPSSEEVPINKSLL